MSGSIDKAADLASDIGEYIKEQRSNAKISLRQLSKLAGVSNPYLSQIERGVRKPSAEILQQIANGLRISAEALYVQAGFLDAPHGGPVFDAVQADTELSERQKQVLLDVYESFRRENAAVAPAAPTQGGVDESSVHNSSVHNSTDAASANTENVTTEVASEPESQTDPRSASQ